MYSELGHDSYLVHVLRLRVAVVGNEGVIVEYNRLSILQVHVKPGAGDVVSVLVLLVNRLQGRVQVWNGTDSKDTRSLLKGNTGVT